MGGSNDHWERKPGADFGEWRGERPYGAVGRSVSDTVAIETDPAITHDLNRLINQVKAEEAMRKEKKRKENRMIQERFNFNLGVVEVSYSKGHNTPAAYHSCRPEPWRSNWTKMQTRFCARAPVDRVIDAALFCPACGLRVNFKWSQDMPLRELNEQFRLASDLFLVTESDSFASGSDQTGKIVG